MESHEMTIDAARLLHHQAKCGNNNEFSYDDIYTMLDYLMLMLPSSAESCTQQASEAIAANT